MPKPTRLSIETSGFVEAAARTSISAEVSGKIIETSESFHVGEFFKKGDVILKIDPTDYETAANVAESRLSVCKKLLADEERLARDSIKDWEEENEKKPEIDRDKEPPPEVTRETPLEVARSNLLASQAELKKAETSLERTVIRAPYNALLIDKQVDVGQFLTPGFFLATLVAIDYAEIRLPIDYSEIPFLNLPRGPLKTDNDGIIDVTIHFPGGVRKGTIVRTENTIDEKTRSLYAIAQIKDPYLWFTEGKGKLQPIVLGQFVKAVVNSEPIDDLVELPRGTLRGEQEVVIADKDTLSIRRIDKVHETADQIYVRGLTPGERVVLTSPHLAYEGERVEVEVEHNSTNIR